MAEQNGRDSVRIELTPAQTDKIRQATGREVLEIELTVEELEPRVTPRLALNHNETLLADAE